MIQILFSFYCPPFSTLAKIQDPAGWTELCGNYLRTSQALTAADGGGKLPHPQQGLHRGEGEQVKS